MSTSDRPTGSGKSTPGRNRNGRDAAQARKDRQAEQLRANLAKRKQQQRKRGGAGGTGDDA